MEHKSNKDALITEYKIGNELCQTYLKGSWTVISILYPISFGLVAISYTKEMLTVAGWELMPLALASGALFLYGWAHGWRYSVFNKSIWNRLRKIEEEKGMQLHTRVDKDNQCRFWRLRKVNFAMLGTLIAVWALRMLLPPLA